MTDHDVSVRLAAALKGAGQWGRLPRSADGKWGGGTADGGHDAGTDGSHEAALALHHAAGRNTTAGRVSAVARAHQAGAQRLANRAGGDRRDPFGRESGDKSYGMHPAHSQPVIDRLNDALKGWHTAWLHESRGHDGEWMGAGGAPQPKADPLAAHLAAIKGFQQRIESGDAQAISDMENYMDRLDAKTARQLAQRTDAYSPVT